MNRSRRKYVLGGCVAGVVLLAGICRSQEPAARADDRKWLEDHSATISPRAAPVPVLKYQLFPRRNELTEGNAVPIYLRFAHERNDATKRELLEKLDRWTKMPPEKLPKAEVRAFIDRWKYNLRQMEIAARRKTADWGYAYQDNPVEALLPDIQEMRMQIRLLVVKARLEAAEGDFAAAARTLETAFSFARQISQGPFLIGGLVAVAGAHLSADAILDIISQPGAPNLYWALTALPRPLINLRPAMETDTGILELQFPDLAHLDRPRSPQEWEQTLTRVRQELERLMRPPFQSRMQPKPGTTARDPAERSPDLPEAKKYLTETAGLPASTVEAMPAAQVLLRYLSGRFNEFRDQMLAATYLPYPQGLPMAAAAFQRLKSAPLTEATRLAELMLPATEKVELSQARLDRKIAMLRVIEALRIYAAAHDGRLPDRLDDVHEVPIPLDPGTDQPFEYHRDGQTATLESRLPGYAPSGHGLRYRVTMRK